MPASFFLSLSVNIRNLLHASQFKFTGFQALFLGYLPIQQAPVGAFRM